MEALAGFEIKNVAHAGQNSVVYRGCRVSDGRSVFIKTLPRDSMGFEGAARLKHEHNIGHVLKSDKVIAYLDVIEQNNVPYVVTEDCQCTSVIEQLPTSGFQIADFLDVALCLVEAIEDIHRHNVIHKDINPRNILWHSQRKQLKVIDFGIATKLSVERQDFSSVNGLEGSLPYISPEQTGRMNRGLDYRSDYYSLGLTLHELLTGKPVFEANDALGWISCHISRIPKAPKKESGDVPNAISKIIQKLIQKNPEDRYQSTLGIRHDLKRCQTQLKEAGQISDFVIAERDICGKFQMPQKLYGRSAELNVLHQVFEEAVGGDSKLLMVSGFSGIGKSALVRDLCKETVFKSGYFIEGKFDKLSRGAPYSALSSALGDLTRQILSESNQNLSPMVTQLKTVLGPNGQIILDLVPRLSSLIGSQPKLQELGPAESQNRFQIVLHDFIDVFARKNHPLVLFLDDLHWADAPTLLLLEKLATSKTLSHLLIIGAYRSNEVTIDHPLSRCIAAIEKQKRITTIELKSLSQKMVTSIIGDVFAWKEQQATQFGEMVYAQTAGNPFLTEELLKILYSDGTIQFNAQQGQWLWKNSGENYREAASIDELLLTTIYRFSQAARQLMGVAACIGNTFDLETLALVNQKSMWETVGQLWEILESGMIEPLSENYRLYMLEGSTGFLTQGGYKDKSPRFRFQHDKVHQVAYALIPPVERESQHLSIGWLLLGNTPAECLERNVIEIAGHINEGRRLIDDPAKLDTLIDLNLKAAKKAMRSLAFEQARGYLEIGIELLSEKAWQDQYDLRFELTTCLAQCLFMVKKIDAADEMIDLVLANAKTAEEKAEVLLLKTRHYAVITKHEQAVQAAIEGLAHVGVRLSSRVGKLAIVKELLLVKWNLGRRKIVDLVNSEQLVCKRKRIAQKLMMELGAPAYILGNETLLTVMALKMTNIALRHGISAEAAYGFAFYGVILGSVMKKQSDGYQFGQLAMAVNKKFDDVELKSRIHLLYGLLIHHWSNPPKTTSPILEAGYHAGYQSGDLLYMRYNALNILTHDPSVNLKTVCDTQRQYLEAVDDFEYEEASDANQLHLQKNMCYRGLTDGQLSMTNDNWNETISLQNMQRRDFKNGITGYHQYKSEICLMFGEYQKCLEYNLKVEKNKQAVMGMPMEVAVCACSFFSRTQLYEELPYVKKREAKKRIKRDYKKVVRWARYNPANVQHLERLMAAEIARIEGKFKEACELYDLGIADAKANEFFEKAGLGCEWAALHFLKNGNSKAALGYLIDACELFKTWGADAKVAQLEKKYHAVFEDELHVQIPQEAEKKIAQNSSSQSSSQSSSAREAENLDVHTVIKASQAISSEIDMDKLLSGMMDIIIENAGAQKGYLLLETKGDLLIRAGAYTDERSNLTVSNTQCSSDLDKSDLLPKSVVYYAYRTGKKVLSGNLFKEGGYTNDSYVAVHRPLSVLCLPIKRQKKTIGVLYLENSLTPDAFTEKRVDLLRAILSQAAISLENADLYKTLLKNEQRLESILNHTPAVVYMKDRNLNYIFVNRKFEQLFKVSLDQILGKSDLEIFSSARAAMVQSNDKQVLHSKAPVECDENYSIGSDVRSFLSVKFPLVDDKQELYAICSISTDITDRKKMQQTLIQNEKMMSIGGLAAGMAHEINNPLAVIIQSTALLKKRLRIDNTTSKNAVKKRGLDEKELAGYLAERKIDTLVDAVQESGIRAADIIKNMLSFARNETTPNQLCSISKLMDKTIEFAQNDFEFHKIEIVRQYEADVEDILCNPVELQQVFLNILKNGAEAFREKNQLGFQPRLTISIVSLVGWIEIKIRDNGPGVDKQNTARLFEPFYTTKSVGNGTGLGLSVSYYIITENHGGQIEVESTEGKGATFCIKLPLPRN